ncbi:hypothetical protein PC121_g9530 [Phytophthora cactorum]|nr:hypothetical protein PC120_g12772 [Phytophthora cactorum]KAG3070399.1 hypothetical protein PC121_g9530 [Phytophthora cactorum]
MLAELDCSFGPTEEVGVVLPPEVRNLQEFQTVKVEIGVSQGWPSLDCKSAIWRGYASVEYVVPIRLSPSLRIRQYRLEMRLGGQFPGDDDGNRASILPIDQNAIVPFDAHLLLGLPAGAALPRGFNDPVLLHLFDLVEGIGLRENAG